MVETKEVRQEIELWRDAIAGEVGSLVEKRAIEIYKGERAREYVREHPAATTYPAKPVFVAKKTGKKKCRVVICGNFITAESNENTYSSTPDATGVRLVLRLGAFLDEVDIEELRKRGINVEEIERSLNEDFNGKLDVASVGVSTAFLNADLSPEDLSKGICTRPPQNSHRGRFSTRRRPMGVEESTLWPTRSPEVLVNAAKQGAERDQDTDEERSTDGGRVEVRSRTAEDGSWQDS